MTKAQVKSFLFVVATFSIALALMLRG